MVFFRDAYKSLINSDLVLSGLDDPLLREFHACGIPSENSIQGFFTGAEAEGSANPLKELFSFSVLEGLLSKL